MKKTLFSAVACGALALAGLSMAQPSAEEKLKDPKISPCGPGQVTVAARCVSAAIPSKAAAPAASTIPPRAGSGTRSVGGLALVAKKMVYLAVPGSIVALQVTQERGAPNPSYEFVKRIYFEDVPASRSAESISAMMADPVTNMIYVSTRGTLYAIDAATDKVVWKNRYEEGSCCERGGITADGLTLIMGSNLKDYHYVIDAKTGQMLRKIDAKASPNIHNMVLSADGKIDFAAPNGYTMTIADVASGNTLKTITFTDHVRVFVRNHDSSRLYVNENNLLGFEIADVASGKIIKRIEAPAELWKAKWADPNLQFYGHGAPHHGIAMTPDESEIWITDAINLDVLVYDNTGEWPVLNMSKKFMTNGKDNGWIVMDLDGKHALMASGDVVDVKTHKVVAQLTDEYGRYMNSEKMLEIAFDAEGHIEKVTDQFANGIASAYNARIASEKAAGQQASR